MELREPVGGCGERRGERQLEGDSNGLAGACTRGSWTAHVLTGEAQVPERAAALGLRRELSLGSARLPIFTKSVRAKLRDSFESKPQGPGGVGQCGGAATQRSGSQRLLFGRAAGCFDP